VEMSVCVRCGGQLQPGAQFCPRCGMNQVPTWLAPGSAPSFAGVAGPAGATYPVSATAPMSTPAAAVDRPFGIAMLAIAEIIVAIVSVYVVREYWVWVDYRFSNDNSFLGAFDVAMGLGYAVAAVYGFRLAPRLWRMESAAWQPAVLLSAGLAGLALVDVILWGVQGSDLLGIGGNLTLIAYLNMTHVRRVFGRPPLPFLVQSPAR
jgi:hypothetical protein